MILYMLHNQCKKRSEDFRFLSSSILDLMVIKTIIISCNPTLIISNRVPPTNAKSFVIFTINNLLSEPLMNFDYENMIFKNCVSDLEISL